MGNNETFVPFLALYRKKMAARDALCMFNTWHLPYDDRCSQRPLEASGRRGPGNLLLALLENDEAHLRASCHGICV